MHASAFSHAPSRAVFKGNPAVGEVGLSHFRNRAGVRGMRADEENVAFLKFLRIKAMFV
jgi:hypothetical protein